MKARPKEEDYISEGYIKSKYEIALEKHISQQDQQIKKLKELLIKSERSLSSNFCGVLKSEIKQALK